MSTTLELQDALGVVERLVGSLDPACLDVVFASELVEVFARGERLCAAGKALAARRVEEAGTWRAEGFRSSAHWLAAASGSTIGDAEGALRATRAVDALPATEAAFRAGELSSVQFREVVEAASAAPEAEVSLLESASAASLKVLRRKCREVRAQSVADDAAWAARLHAGRRLDRWTDSDGMGRGDWKLPPDASARLDAALEAEIDVIWRAARREGRREPRAAYAADAMVNLVARGPLKAPEVKCTFDLAPLERGYAMAGERCEIDGIGPVPVTIARAMFQDSRVSFLIREDGDIRTVTSPKPTIPRRFRRRLEERDPVCGNCGEDGPFEIDHIVPRHEHGQTELANLWRLCRHCHRLKTYFGWRAVARKDGGHELVPP